MRIVGLRLICHHFFLSTRRSSRKSLRILYHSVLNKGKWKSQHETGEGVQLSMSFFADAYPRQIDVLTHISPFWRTYESNDKSLGISVLVIQSNGHAPAHRLCLVPSTAWLKNVQSRDTMSSG